MIKEAMPVRAITLALLVAGGAVTAPVAPMTSIVTEATSLGRGPLLHAHNCYPEDGRWTDRLDRALATASRPIVIEQDLAWDPAGRRPVLSHGTTLTGQEPPLEEHFFNRVRPVIERALAEDRRDTWPVVVLHLDFKTNEPEHHRAVWDLLGKYESWLTWAPRVADGAAPQALRPGPLLVLTEQGAGQEEVFSTRVPIGARLRLFGTVPPTPRATSGDRDADLRAAGARGAGLVDSGARDELPALDESLLGRRRRGRTVAERRLDGGRRRPSARDRQSRPRAWASGSASTP